MQQFKDLVCVPKALQRTQSGRLRLRRSTTASSRNPPDDDAAAATSDDDDVARRGSNVSSASKASRSRRKVLAQRWLSRHGNTAPAEDTRPLLLPEREPAVPLPRAQVRVEEASGNGVRALTQASPSIEEAEREQGASREKRRSQRLSDRYSVASLREAAEHVLSDALLPSERLEQEASEAAQASDEEADDAFNSNEFDDARAVSFEEEAHKKRHSGRRRSREAFERGQLRLASAREAEGCVGLLTRLAEDAPPGVVARVASFLHSHETVRLAFVSTALLRATHGLALRLDDRKRVMDYRLLEQVFDPYTRERRRTPWRVSGLYTGISELATLFRVVEGADVEFLGVVNPRVSCIAPVRACTSLRAFELHGCEADVDLSPLLALAETLEAVSLLACPRIQDLSLVEQLPRLRVLSAFKSSGVRALPDLRRLPRLELLSMGECRDLADVRGVAALRGLRTLDLSFVKSVRSLASLRGCPQLRGLILDSCMNLPSLDGLEACGAALRTLRLNNMMQLRDIAPVAQCAQLASLEMAALVNVTDLGPLEGCPALADVLLQDCLKIASLEPLRAAAPTLRRLIVSGCRGLREPARDADVVEASTGLAVFACERCEPAFLVALMSSGRASVVAAAESQLASVSRSVFADKVLPAALARWERARGVEDRRGCLGALRVLQVCAGSAAALDVMAAKGVVDNLLLALQAAQPGWTPESGEPGAVWLETLCTLSAMVRVKPAAVAVLGSSRALAMLGAALELGPSGSELANLEAQEQDRRRRSTASSRGSARSRGGSSVALSRCTAAAAERRSAEAGRVLARALGQTAPGSAERAAASARVVRHGDALRRAAEVVAAPRVMDRSRQPMLLLLRAVVEDLPDLAQELVVAHEFAPVLLRAMLHGSLDTRVVGAALLAALVADAPGLEDARVKHDCVMRAVVETPGALAMLTDFIGSANWDLVASSADALAHAPPSMLRDLARAEGLVSALLNGLQEGCRQQRAAVAPAPGSGAALAACARALAALTSARDVVLQDLVAEERGSGKKAASSDPLDDAARPHSCDLLVDRLVAALEVGTLDARVHSARACLHLAAHSPACRSALAAAIAQPAAAAHLVRFAAAAAAARSGLHPSAAAVRDPGAALEFLQLFLALTPQPAPLASVPAAEMGELCAGLARGVLDGAASCSVAAGVAARMLEESGHGDLVRDALLLPVAAAVDRRRTHLQRLLATVLSPGRLHALRRRSLPAAALRRASAGAAAGDLLAADASAADAARARAVRFLGNVLRAGGRAAGIVRGVMLAPDTRVASVFAALADGAPRTAAGAAELLLLCAAPAVAAAGHDSSVAQPPSPEATRLALAVDRVFLHNPPLGALALARVARTADDDDEASGALAALLLLRELCARLPAMRSAALGQRTAQRGSAVRQQQQQQLQNPLLRAVTRALRSDPPATRPFAAASDCTDITDVEEGGLPGADSDDDLDGEYPSDAGARSDESDDEANSQHAPVGPDARGRRSAPVLRAIARAMRSARGASETAVVGACCALLDELAHADADAVRRGALLPLLRALPASAREAADAEADTSGEEDNDSGAAVQRGGPKSRSALRALELAAEMRGSALRETLLDAHAPDVLAARLCGPLARADETAPLLRALRGLLPTPAASAASELADLCARHPLLARAALSAAADPSADAGARAALVPLLALAGAEGDAASLALADAMAGAGLADALDDWRHWLSARADDALQLAKLGDNARVGALPSVEDVELCEQLVGLAQSACAAPDDVGALEDALLLLLLHDARHDMRRAYVRVALALDADLACDASAAFRRSALASDAGVQGALARETSLVAAQRRRYPVALTRVRGLPDAGSVSRKRAKGAEMHSVRLRQWATVSLATGPRSAAADLDAAPRASSDDDAPLLLAHRRLYFEVELRSAPSADAVVGWLARDFERGVLRGGCAEGVDASGRAGSSSFGWARGVDEVWAAGDVLGVAADLDGRRLTLTVNGGGARDLRTRDKEELLLPAASATALDAFFNFGSRPFRFSPPARGFRSIFRALDTSGL